MEKMIYYPVIGKQTAAFGRGKRMKDGEKSFSKLFELVELLSNSREGLSGREISERSGIPLSTTFRMLKFMTDSGYFRSNGGIYFLGVKFIRLGNIACEQNPLIRIAQPKLESLAARTLETVHLAERKDREIQYIGKVEGRRSIRMGSLIGKRSPIYCTGVGKVILAFMPDSERESLLRELEFRPYTAKTITSREDLCSELLRIRRKGYAVDDCEHEEGVYCLAAPILNGGNRCIAGISISGAEIYIRKEREKFAVLLMETAREISRML